MLCEVYSHHTHFRRGTADWMWIRMPDDTMVFVDDTGIVPSMAYDWPSFTYIRNSAVALFMADGRWTKVGYINLDTGEITNAS